MSDDDKRLIAWALCHYADAAERNVLAKFMPEGTSRDAKRCRELANIFYPYEWIPTKVKP